MRPYSCLLHFGSTAAWKRNGIVDTVYFPGPRLYLAYLIHSHLSHPAAAQSSLSLVAMMACSAGPCRPFLPLSGSWGRLTLSQLAPPEASFPRYKPSSQPRSPNFTRPAQLAIVNGSALTRRRRRARRLRPTTATTIDQEGAVTTRDANTDLHRKENTSEVTLRYIADDIANHTTLDRQFELENARRTLNR